MITERHFATSFPAFWKELLPLLTPSRVHLLNAYHEEHLVNEHGEVIAAVEAQEETRDAAIISEFAYYLAAEAFRRSLPVRDAFEDASIRGIAEKLAFQLVNRYEGRSSLTEITLNAIELDEGFKLASNYEYFARLHGGIDKCTFQVPIKSAGFLYACNADLVIDNYLVEVKTVKRPLAGKDIRQLVIYLALSSVAHQHRWQYAGFFNPRRATYHRFETSELIDVMSGGKSIIDVFTEILDFTCSSDVQLDSTF